MSCFKIKCADAATENCPCHLAETGHCLVCSMIQGKGKCECDWTGVCVLGQYIFNSNRKNPPRSQRAFHITDIRHLLPDFVVITVKAPSDFIASCMMPGTYVFIRNPETPHYYDTPVSLLDCDLNAGTFTVGIRVLGAKTKSLSDNNSRHFSVAELCMSTPEKQTEPSDISNHETPAIEPGESEKTEIVSGIHGNLIVRGPYRNGIPGLDKKISGKHITICAKGAGVCPAIFTYKCLISKNNVKIIINDGVIERRLCEMFLAGSDNYIFDDLEKAFQTAEADHNDYTANAEKTGDCSDAQFDCDLHGDTDKKYDLFSAKIEQEKDTDCFIVLGCSQFTADVSRRLSDVHLAAAVLKSRDGVVCCGEGVCGACGKVQTPDGPVPACKVR